MDGKQRTIVGGFLVGATLLFVVGLFLIGDRRLLFERQFELNTALGRVTGLEVGAKVRVAGLDAGEVLEIGLPSGPSERFRVRMRLREDVRPIVRTDSVAAVQTDGIVGSTFIQIGRGTDAARMVEPGDTIEGQDPIEFADLIEQGRETFRIASRQMTDVTEAVLDTITTLNETARAATQTIVAVGEDVQTITGTGSRMVEQAELLIEDGRGVVADVRAGKGTFGQLLTDDAPYQRWVGIASEAEQAVANLRQMTDRTRTLVEGITAPDGAGQQIIQVLRDTAADSREVVSDLSESTEALKRNFLFRGFFRRRGFFDLDTISRDAYLAGALEGGNRTALRVWIDAGVLFAPGPDGTEQLTPSGRRRLDSAMADLVRYPRDSPLVVEGYAESTASEPAYARSTDRARTVREYVLGRFGRRATLTGMMAMSDEAPGSPRGDGRWSGVALTIFVGNDTFAVAP